MAVVPESWYAAHVITLLLATSEQTNINKIRLEAQITYICHFKFLTNFILIANPT